MCSCSPLTCVFVFFWTATILSSLYPIIVVFLPALQSGSAFQCSSIECCRTYYECSFTPTEALPTPQFCDHCNERFPDGSICAAEIPDSSSTIMYLTAGVAFYMLIITLLYSYDQWRIFNKYNSQAIQLEFQGQQPKSSVEMAARNTTGTTGSPNSPSHSESVITGQRSQHITVAPRSEHTVGCCPYVETTNLHLWHLWQIASFGPRVMKPTDVDRIREEHPNLAKSWCVSSWLFNDFLVFVILCLVGTQLVVYVQSFSADACYERASGRKPSHANFWSQSAAVLVIIKLSLSLFHKVVLLIAMRWGCWCYMCQLQPFDLEPPSYAFESDSDDPEVFSGQSTQAFSNSKVTNSTAAGTSAISLATESPTSRVQQPSIIVTSDGKVSPQILALWKEIASSDTRFHSQKSLQQPNASSMQLLAALQPLNDSNMHSYRALLTDLLVDQLQA